LENKNLSRRKTDFALLGTLAGRHFLVRNFRELHEHTIDLKYLRTTAVLSYLISGQPENKQVERK